MPPDRIAAILLAAGLSSRMGENKLLLELEGRSLVRRAAETAREAGLDPLLVVVGHQREQVEAALEGIACVPVLNPDYASGMYSSLQAGIAAVPADCAGAVIILGDMPLVTSAMVRAVVDGWRLGSSPLALSLYDRVVAPPILYSRALFAELLADKGDENRKKVVLRHRREALELNWPPLSLTDLDLPEDVERVRAYLKEASPL